MVPPLEESEDGDRASFSRWEKRSVISDHFAELVLDTWKWKCYKSVRSYDFLKDGG